jgi:hypothetical protein
MALYTAGNNFAIDSVRATTSNGAIATLTINKTGGIIGARISSLTASSTSVADGETSIITATVTDGNANPMMGEPVTFTIPTNDSNACFINAANACVPSVIVSTDGSGRAMAVYHGGSRSPNVDVYDTVRATLANGSTNFVVITRSSTTPLGLTVTAAPATLNAGQVSIITAKLTGANNSGVAVSFTLPVNNSGATLSASTAITDGAGNAVVIYSAGANNPTQTVSDSVRASAGAMTGAVAITRTGSGTPPSNSITITANPATVAAGQVSIITANVKSGAAAAVGVAVTFTVPINNSGATLSAATAITDGAGNAVVTYTAGANNPTLTVYDTVRAAVGSVSSEAAITRTGSGGTAYSISVSANPGTLTLVTASSVITANVQDNLGTAVSGVTVTFTVTGPVIRGTVLPLTSVTDASGNASTTFTGNGAGDPPFRATGDTDVVTASITVGGSPSASVVITYP